MTPFNRKDLVEFQKEQELTVMGAALFEGGAGGLAATGVAGKALYRRRSVWLGFTGADDGRLSPDWDEAPARLIVGIDRPAVSVPRGMSHGWGVRAGAGFDENGYRAAEAQGHLALLPGINLLGWTSLDLEPALVLRLRVRRFENDDLPLWSPTVGLASWRWPALANDLALTYDAKTDSRKGNLPRSAGIWRLAYTPGLNRGAGAFHLSLHGAYQHPWDGRSHSRFSAGFSVMYNRVRDL